MSKKTQAEYDKLTLEEKAQLWQDEADKIGPGFCKDNYNRYAEEIRARIKGKK